MADWTVVALRFGIALTVALAFGVPLQLLLSDRRSVERRSMLMLILASLILSGLVLSALGLVALSAAMAGTDIFPVDRATLQMIVDETALGRSFVVRFAALAMAVGALVVPGPIGVGRLLAIVGTTGVAIATLAWTDHGMMDEGVRGWIHLLSDIVHLLAAAAWIGAIAVLLVSVTGASDRLWEVRAALARFAKTGSVLVESIAVSGAINGWMILGRDRAAQVFRSDYGRLLIVKIALFGAMLLIAATNRWVLTPYLQRAIQTDRTRAPLRWLGISLIAELTCAVAIVAVVAWLGTLSP